MTREDSTASGPWRLQVAWQSVVVEQYPTFEAAHERAVQLVRDHPNASGNVSGANGQVAVLASYYAAPEDGT